MHLMRYDDRKNNPPRKRPAAEDRRAMASLFNIMKITVDDTKARARVLVNLGMPLMTSEDIEATARVYYLAPAIAQHACFGDAGEKFQDCMGDTELVHLLEHLTVEIMNETGLAGDISSGRTRSVAEDPRLFEIELSCPDDALTIGALSSASFMMEWAFLHPDVTAPDFAGTVEALRQLVLSLRGESEPDDGAAAEGIEAEAESDAELEAGEGQQVEASADATGAEEDASFAAAPGDAAQDSEA